jgi:hypothetical protein
MDLKRLVMPSDSVVANRACSTGGPALDPVLAYSIYI